MMIKLPLLFLLIPFSVFCQTAAKVVGISDGDTITVLLEGNIQKKLRLVTRVSLRAEHEQ